MPLPFNFRPFFVAAWPHSCQVCHTWTAGACAARLPCGTPRFGIRRRCISCCSHFGTRQHHNFCCSYFSRQRLSSCFVRCCARCSVYIPVSRALYAKLRLISVLLFLFRTTPRLNSCQNSVCARLSLSSLTLWLSTTTLGSHILWHQSTAFLHSLLTRCSLFFRHSKWWHAANLPKLFSCDRRRHA